MLSSYSGCELSEDDFYFNAPHNMSLLLDYEVSNGIDPDMVETLMRNILGGEITRSPMGAERASLLHLAAQWQHQKSGVIVLADNHYVAFKKGINPRNNQRQWVMIDSARQEQFHSGPHDFLMEENPANFVLLGWKPDTPGMCLPRCALQ
jgi:hypothetical protein